MVQSKLLLTSLVFLLVGCASKSPSTPRASAVSQALTEPDKPTEPDRTSAPTEPTESSEPASPQEKPTTLPASQVALNYDGTPRVLGPSAPSVPGQYLVLPYDDFGPSQVGPGSELYVWRPCGGCSHPDDRADVRVVVHLQKDHESAKKRYPTIKNQSDHRLLSLTAALSLIDEQLAITEEALQEEEPSEMWARMNAQKLATRRQIVDWFKARLNLVDSQGTIDWHQLDRHEYAQFPCGSFHVHRSVSRKGEQRLWVTDEQMGKALVSWTTPGTDEGPHELRPLQCVDLNGDKTPELMIDIKDLGPHCCHKHVATDLQKAQEPLLVFEEGNGGGGLTILREKKGTAALRGSSNIFMESWFHEIAQREPFFSLPYAFTPRPPIFFRLKKGKYEPSTSSYPALLRKMRSDLPLRFNDQDEASDILQFVALSLLLGDWQANRSKLDPSVPQSELNEIASYLKAHLK